MTTAKQSLIKSDSFSNSSRSISFT
jgi:hypothetical protein